MSSFHLAAALAIFTATYAVIAFARLPRLPIDRPGAAVCGAALMVVFGVLPFDQAWSAINGHTIILLFGMMIINVLLEDSGFFALITDRVLRFARSPRTLLAALTLLSGILSALFLNDTVCLMLTVPVMTLVRHARLPYVPFLMALAMGTNVGSVMTVIGNPQNMLIGIYSGWSYAQFLLWMAPVGLAGLGVLILILLGFYGHRLRTLAPTMAGTFDSPAVDRRLLTKSLVVSTGVMIGFVVVGDLPAVALAGAVLLLVISGRPTGQVLARVNWVLLVFFAGLFVVVEGLEQTGLIAAAADRIRPLYGDSLATQVPVFGTLVVLGSNVVSNVPLVVLARGIVPELVEPQLMWLILAMASTFAGNLTIPGSVATLIVLETARNQPDGRAANIGFWEFLRVGVPVTLATTMLGTLLLVAEYWLLELGSR